MSTEPIIGISLAPVLRAQLRDALDDTLPCTMLSATGVPCGRRSIFLCRACQRLDDSQLSARCATHALGETCCRCGEFVTSIGALRRAIFPELETPNMVNDAQDKPAPEVRPPALVERDAFTTVAPPSRRVGPVSARMQQLDELLRIAQWAAESALFKTSGNMRVATAQCAVRMMAGSDLGLSEMQSLRNIYIIEGQVVMSYTAQLARVKQAGRRYEIVQSPDRVTIHWWERDPETRAWLKQGESAFSMDDAKRAGLLSKDNWQKYPMNMMTARAVTNGNRVFNPDLFFGSIYVAEELRSTIVTNEFGEPIGADATVPIANAEGIRPDSPWRAQIEALVARNPKKWTRAGIDVLLRSCNGDEEAVLRKMVEAENEPARGRTVETGEVIDATPPAESPPADKVVPVNGPDGAAAESPKPAPPAPRADLSESPADKVVPENAPGAAAAEPPPKSKPDPEGAMSNETRAALFGLLGKLGLRGTRHERLAWAKRYGVEVASYQQLTQREALALCKYAEEELRAREIAAKATGGSPVTDSYCAQCQAPHGAPHKTGCPDDEPAPTQAPLL